MEPLTPTVPVFYTPKMVADSQSASPSAAKPEKVVASWQSKFKVEIIEPQPATVEELSRAHDPQWVKKVLAGEADNGFGNRSLEVAASLPYTSGSMLSAAKFVLGKGYVFDDKMTQIRAAGGSRVAAAPCSGFHHAEYQKAMGYCTFNGLMVTALALYEEGLLDGKPIGILDLDMHYGNGTDHILQRRVLMNGDNFVRHFTGGKFYTQPTHVEDFFRTLPRILERMSDCAIVLYQAGADPHIDDPHGGWLTTPELKRRDEMVFETLIEAGVPVVWNLAGGYQVERDGSIPKVLEIHDNTMAACIQALTSL